MIVHVDEAGRDDQSRGIDTPRGVRAGQVPNGGDPPVQDSDVGLPPLRAAAINDRPAGNYQIIGLATAGAGEKDPKNTCDRQARYKATFHMRVIVARSFQPGRRTRCGRAYRPFWSPDSGSIGFWTGGELMRVTVEGGP